MRYTCMALSCLSLLFLTASCNREDLPEKDAPLVKRIDAATGDSTSIWEFFYDSTNHVEQIKFENNNGHRAHITIPESINDTAVVSTWQGTTAGGTTSTDTLVYDEGRVIKKLGRYGISIYVYDTRGRLIADSSGGRIPWNNEMKIGRSFVYDNDDNVVRINGYQDSGGVQVIGTVTNITHTSGLNPYYRLGVLYYIAGYSTQSLSRHNLSTVTYTNNFTGAHIGTDRYTYNYNHGILTRMTVKNENWAGSFSASTFNFFY